ncbi:arrestin domain-containing protein 3-like isoform X2 [Lutzomyia longipalpis]|uniref:arrestin domain-containing protein 3-like isoform X2 n=1 Tax=Lutzomyia longipalpis TaxID=7200 RepID=UPI002483FC6D|nr:arrestin domain-containing protein 3-like isoform X2 [Lutzomyia longipalpis]
MVNCDIKFSSAQGIYYSGQTLSIQVSLRFEKAKKFRSIYVVFNGRAKCSLSKNYGTHARRQRVVYRAEEIYVNTKSYLHGNETTEATELSAGTHVYTVACALPPELPSSFEGNYGSIRYSVKVVVDRPWKFDHTFEEIFTVLKQYDLNFDSSLRLPFERQKVSTFCFWPFRTGPMQVIVKLPQTGFVPGQIVPVTVDINNDSGTSINYFRLLLMKYVLYHAQTPRPKTRRQREIVVNNRVEKNILGMGRTQAQISLEIPSLPPTNIIHNRIIHITYELKVCAKTPRCSEDLEIRVPIVIGTVPIFTGPPPMASSSSDGADGPGFNPNLPPPSYEECVSGKDDMKEEDSDNKSNTKPFAPMYPVYRYDVASHSATTPTLQSPPPQKFYPNP